MDNLPRSMTKGWLWQLFSFEGKVADTYISYKKRKSTENLFGFVRFFHKEEATKVVNNLHGIVIRGCKLSVQVATYGRNNRKHPQIQGKVKQKYKPKLPSSIHDERSFREVLMGCKKNQIVNHGQDAWKEKIHRGEQKKIEKSPNDERPNNSVFITGDVSEEKREGLTGVVLAL